MAGRVEKVPKPLFPGDRSARGTYRVCPTHRDTILQSFGGSYHDGSTGWCPTCQKGVKAVTVRVR